MNWEIVWKKLPRAANNRRYIYKIKKEEQIEKIQHTFSMRFRRIIEKIVTTQKCKNSSRQLSRTDHQSISKYSKSFRIKSIFAQDTSE